MRRFFLLCALGCVFLAGAGMKYWAFYSQPFELEAYLRFVLDEEYVLPRERLRFLDDLVTENRIAVHGEPSFDPANPARRAYFVDAQRLLESWHAPVNFRRFTQRSVHRGGIAFACVQLLIVDGSILDRSVQDFASGMSGIPAEHLTGNIPGTSADYLTAAFFHEFAHVTGFHFNLDETANGFLAAGYAALGSKNYQEAKLQFEKVLSRCPAHYKALDSIAISENRLGRPESALAYYDKSLLINPDNAVARQNSLLVLVTANRLEEALPRAEAYARQDETNPEYPFWIGVARAKRGEMQPAFESLTRARALYLERGDFKITHANLLRAAIAGSRPALKDRLTAVLAQSREDCLAVKGDKAAQASQCAYDDDAFLAYGRRLLNSLMKP